MHAVRNDPRLIRSEGTVSSIARFLARLARALAVVLIIGSAGSTAAVASHPPPAIQVSPEPPTGWLTGGEYQLTATAASAELVRFYGYVEGGLSLWPGHSCLRSQCEDTVTKTFVLRPGQVPDGVRDLVLTASDWSDPELVGDGPVRFIRERIVTRRFRLQIDHSAPAAPDGLALIGGDTWRAENRFAVRWSAKPDGGSPVVGAEYRICPATSPRGTTDGCVTGRRSGRDVDSIDGLSVPGTGIWRLEVALEDELGHIDREAGAAVAELRLDAEPPRVALLPADAADPARVALTASDDGSGIAAVAIDVRRNGEDRWRSLDVTRTESGAVAVLEDDDLPAGMYEIRGQATDVAGNERIVGRRLDGRLAEIQLPIRQATALTAGVPKRARSRWVLDASPSVRSAPRYPSRAA